MAKLGTYTVFEVADHFLYLGGRDIGLRYPITPMKLQKLVYYAHGHWLALYGEPLITEQFKAWEWGPVVPSLYYAYDQYARMPIPPPPDYDLGHLDRDTSAFLCDIYRQFGHWSASDLSRQTHVEWPWTRTPPGASIGNDLIRETFIRRLKLPAIATGPFTTDEREWVLDSVLASQALEGVHISREDAGRILDDLETEPLPDLLLLQ